MILKELVEVWVFMFVLSDEIIIYRCIIIQKMRRYRKIALIITISFFCDLKLCYRFTLYVSDC